MNVMVRFQELYDSLCRCKFAGRDDTVFLTRLRHTKECIGDSDGDSDVGCRSAPVV